MSSDDTPSAAVTGSSPEKDVVDRVERSLLSRRRFLTGLGLGSLGGAGAVALTRSDSGFQSLATLAGGDAFPMTRYYIPAVDASGSGLVVPVEFEFP